MTGEHQILDPISDAELARRWALVREAMARRGLQALVMQATNDWLGGYVKYFTDIPANNGYPRTVIFHANRPMTIVEMGPFEGRKRLGGEDPMHRGVEDILQTPSFPSIAYTIPYDGDLVAQELTRAGYRSVGLVNPGAFLHGFLGRIQAASPEPTWSDATDLVDAIKAVKSEEEQELVRRAARLQDEVFARVARRIEPGMRDIDVTTFAQSVAQELGSEQGIFLGASARLGVRSPFLGRHFQGRTLQSGDHLSLLIEVNGPGGMYTELARTLVLGKAPTRLLDAFASVVEAQRHTLDLLKPGVLCRDVAAAHNDWMTARGLPAEMRLYAHGQGYDMVERPIIRADEPMRISAGMNMAVHPGFETPEFFAVVCDNYLIHADGGSEALHLTDKTVFQID